MDTFREIISHQNQIAYLRRVFERKEKPQSLIFHGMSGIGKRTVAIQLVKYVNCLDQRKIGCECKICKKIDLGSYVDLMIFSPNGGRSIGVDVVERLREETFRRPFEGKYKFFILDEAEKLTYPASSALLKVLEEPSPKSFLILISSDYRALISTVRSRCLAIKFGALGSSQIEKYLLERGYSVSQSKIFSRISEGSIGKALAYINSNMLEQREKILEMLERAERNKAFDWILKFSGELSVGGKADRDKALKFLDLCLSIFLDLMTIGCASTIHVDMMERLKQIAEKVGREKVIEAYKEFRKLRINLRFNVNLDLHLMTLFLNFFKAMRKSVRVRKLAALS